MSARFPCWSEHFHLGLVHYSLCFWRKHAAFGNRVGSLSYPEILSRGSLDFAAQKRRANEGAKPGSWIEPYFLLGFEGVVGLLALAVGAKQDLFAGELCHKSLLAGNQRLICFVFKLMLLLQKSRRVERWFDFLPALVGDAEVFFIL